MFEKLFRDKEKREIGPDLTFTYGPPIDKNKDSYPRYFNEWMNDLMHKINQNDKDSSQISAFMCGLMQAPWHGLKSITLNWEVIEDYHNTVSEFRPNIKVEFYEENKG